MRKIPKIEIDEESIIPRQSEEFQERLDYFWQRNLFVSQQLKKAEIEHMDDRVMDTDYPPHFQPYESYFVEYTLPENSVWKVHENMMDKWLYIEGTHEISMKLNGQELTEETSVNEKRTDTGNTIQHYIEKYNNQTRLKINIQDMATNYRYEGSFTITELTIDGTKYPDETITYKSQNVADTTINILPTVRTLKKLVSYYHKT